MVFFITIIVVVGLILLYHYSTKKFLNPYKLTMIFGKKGSGKSTLLTKLALMYVKKGYPVYTTEDIPGTYKIDAERDIGYVEFPENSVILIDEVGTIWDNRNFKNFKPEVRDWFKYQRHRKLIVYLFSQTFDVDLKIRSLVDDFYLVEKKFRVFSYAKRILRKTVLVKASAEAPSKIDEDLVFDSVLFFWCGSRRFTFIPKYSKYYDSFVKNPLKERQFELRPPYIPKIKKGGVLFGLFRH